jgi:hypothetical protein
VRWRFGTAPSFFKSMLSLSYLTTQLNKASHNASTQKAVAAAAKKYVR